ncbi:hypothetical protein MRX96_057927 [Rhipicephalus microplus]
MRQCRLLKFQRHAAHDSALARVSPYLEARVRTHSCAEALHLGQEFRKPLSDATDDLSEPSSGSGVDSEPRLLVNLSTIIISSVLRTPPIVDIAFLDRRISSETLTSCGAKSCAVYFQGQRCVWHTQEDSKYRACDAYRIVTRKKRRLIKPFGPAWRTLRREGPSGTCVHVRVCVCASWVAVCATTSSAALRESSLCRRRRRVRATVGSDDDDERASGAILEAIAKSLFPPAGRYRGIRPSTAAAVVAVSRCRSFRRLRRIAEAPLQSDHDAVSGCRALLPNKSARRRMTKPKCWGDDGGTVNVALCVVCRTSRDSPVAEVPRS